MNDDNRPGKFLMEVLERKLSENKDNPERLKLLKRFNKSRLYRLAHRDLENLNEYDAITLENLLGIPWEKWVMLSWTYRIKKAQKALEREKQRIKATDEYERKEALRQLEGRKL